MKLAQQSVPNAAAVDHADRGVGRPAQLVGLPAADRALGYVATPIVADVGARRADLRRVQGRHHIRVVVHHVVLLKGARSEKKRSHEVSFH